MFFKFDAPQLRYTGRWGTEEGKITTTAVGSYFEFAFTGSMATMHFDLDWQSVPYPHLWISVDGGARAETTLAPYLRVQGADEGMHTVCVIMKSSVEMQHRWYEPRVARVSLKGIEAEGLAELPEDNRKTIELVGDSITEGVMVDVDCRFYREEYQNRPFQDDACGTYAWLTAEKLNLRPYVMAYGAVGTAKSGNGAVPSVVESYPFNFDGSPITFAEPDYILINHGTNDMFQPAETLCTRYRALLDVIRGLHPHSKLIVLAPFFGVHPEALRAMVETYNKEHGVDIAFIDGTGWVPKEPVHPLRESHKLLAERLYAELKDIID